MDTVLPHGVWGPVGSVFFKQGSEGRIESKLEKVKYVRRTNKVNEGGSCYILFAASWFAKVLGAGFAYLSPCISTFLLPLLVLELLQL